MAGIQDFVNANNSSLLGIKTSLDTLATNVAALQAAIAAGATLTPEQQAQLDDAASQSSALAAQASAIASASTPTSAQNP